MASARASETVPQLSQEKILKIMNMVKNKELSVEEALDVAEKEKCIEEKEEKQPTLWVDALDSPNTSQFNFSIHKYKHYRWQKRILQIDLNTKTVFNIEKGIIKKQFPFTQVKSCVNGEGRRFRITFHGRQDYELEAASIDDKNKIIHLVNKFAQSNVNGRPAELGRCQPDPHDVIHEGLLDLQLETTTSLKWVKHLVQLQEQELTIHCIDQCQIEETTPVTQTVNLSNGDVVVSMEDSPGTFSLRTKDVTYLYRNQCGHPATWPKKEIDEDRLYDQFRMQHMMGLPASEPLVKQHIMLNSKIAHNFNIFLKSFRIKPSQLKEKLYIIHEDSGGLSDEQIKALRRYQPTAQDVEMYLSFKGSPSELHVVDQFMLEMCKIPNLGQKLDLLFSVRELPSSIADLEPLINQKIRACKQLRDSSRFVAVLEYILAIGNYLNEKGGREKAKGFQLSSLAKLSLLRGTERNFTLLHALVEQIFLHEPDLAKFSQELTEFKAVSGASIKGLSAEVEGSDSEV